MQMLKGRKSERDQDIMFCNVATIIGSHYKRHNRIASFDQLLAD
jgi:hypothetical protein